MKKNSLSRFLLLGLLVAFAPDLLAQDIYGLVDNSQTDKKSRRRSYEGAVQMNTWSATVRGGYTHFFGELTSRNFSRGSAAKKGTFAAGLSINKQLTNIFGVSGNFDLGNLSSSKKDVYNAYFNANFFQGSLTFDVNLKSLVLGTKKLRRLKLDAFGGIGYMWFNTDVFEIGTDRVLGYSNNPPTSPKTSGKWTDFGSDYTRDLVVPVGLKLDYQLTKRLDLGLMAQLNFLNSSKLDMTKGGSTDHNNAIFVFNDKGDGRRDRWGQLALTLTYKIGRNPAMVTKDGKYPPEAGRYHLRWARPEDVAVPIYNPTMDTALARVKAIMPPPVDPRLYTDTDGDSVADLFDKEPATPPNSVVSGGGVAMDLNKFVKDILDRKKPNDTCLELFTNVEFRTDQAVIPTVSYQNLQNLVEYLNASPDCRVVLVGHADRRESDAYNMRLSQRRSTSVKKYLIKAGLKDPSRVLIEYYGEFKPQAPSATAEGLQANRRVQIKVRANNQWRDYPGN
ncbi:MAG: OmpA family protein [Cytophagaceae bacterium]|nr:OmpA family protein [Cytophagaceae bacterium]